MMAKFAVQQRNNDRNDQARRPRSAVVAPQLTRQRMLLSRDCGVDTQTFHKGTNYVRATQAEEAGAGEKVA